MNDSTSLKNHFNMVNTIVLTTNDLVNNLKKTNTVDNVIYTTTAEIFKFLSKILNIVPELLISNYQNSIKKSVLNHDFDEVIDAWSEYFIDRNSFFEKWDSFLKSWKLFFSKFENSNYLENTIFISLN